MIFIKLFLDFDSHGILMLLIRCIVNKLGPFKSGPLVEIVEWREWLFTFSSSSFELIKTYPKLEF